MSWSTRMGTRSSLTLGPPRLYRGGLSPWLGLLSIWLPKWLVGAGTRFRLICGPWVWWFTKWSRADCRSRMTQITSCQSTRPYYVGGSKSISLGHRRSVCNWSRCCSILSRRCEVTLEVCESTSFLGGWTGVSCWWRLDRAPLFPRETAKIRISRRLWPRRREFGMISVRWSWMRVWS